MGNGRYCGKGGREMIQELCKIGFLLLSAIEFGYWLESTQVGFGIFAFGMFLDTLVYRQGR